LLVRSADSGKLREEKQVVCESLTRITMILNKRKSSNLNVMMPGRSAALNLVQSSKIARRMAQVLIVGMLVSILGMAFLPWQQTSRGSGQVVALDPQQRPQTVESPSKGIIVKVAEGLLEGSKVKKDQVLLELEPFAGDLVSQLNAQLDQLNAKLKSTQNMRDVYKKNVNYFTDAQEFAVNSALDMVESSKAKLESIREKIPGAESKEHQAKLQYDRQVELLDKGWNAEKDFEKGRKDWEVAESDLKALLQEMKSVEKEVESKKKQVEEKRSVTQTYIEKARAEEQDAIGKIAGIEKEIGDIQIKLGALKRLTISAPCDGTIMRMPVYPRGKTVKENEPLLTIVPDSTQNAVELLVMGNDMPLVQVGQEVRLQFEGWPGVQFAGWPSVAIGTFSGRVTSVDPTDNGKGKFRILVIPNKDDKKWPAKKYLRQGVRVNGWVMLKRVTLGYEVWRQLNGFPVILSEDDPDKKPSKVPKLPK